MAIELEDGERLVGFKSRKSYDELAALHYDFKFIVGRLVWQKTLPPLFNRAIIQINIIQLIN